MQTLQLLSAKCINISSDFAHIILVIRVLAIQNRMEPNVGNERHAGILNDTECLHFADQDPPQST